MKKSLLLFLCMPIIGYGQIKKGAIMLSFEGIGYSSNSYTLSSNMASTLNHSNINTPAFIQNNYWYSF